MSKAETSTPEQVIPWVPNALFGHHAIPVPAVPKNTKCPLPAVLFLIGHTHRPGALSGLYVHSMLEFAEKLLHTGRTGLPFDH